MDTLVRTSHFFQTQLTGGWQVQPVPLHTNEWYEDGDWVTVPDSAHLQPILYPERPYWGDHLRAINQQAWIYRRTFTVPDGDYRRVRLRFDGVDYFAAVWVNGQWAGEHEGHFAPFSLDVTGLLHPGENVLVVRVSAPWDAPNPKGTYPLDHVIRGLVKGLYEHGEGVIPPDVNPIGIWRPVWLVMDDGVSLDHCRIRTELIGQVDLRVTYTNATGETWDGWLDLSIAAENHRGGGVSAVYQVHLPPGTHRLDYTVYIRDPHLWWSWDQGSPDLYRLHGALRGSRGTILSEYDDTFGLRTVRLERSPQRFTYWLNERPVFMRGTAYLPALYLSQCTRASVEEDIRLARQANLNLLRMHVHVSPPDVYELCDRVGMLIWQDFELNWEHDSSPDFENRARVLQREMLNMLGNHPSIVTWACHNEPTMVFARRQNLEQHPDPALYTDAIEQDSTRPVFICSGQTQGDWKRSGDVHSYYGALWTKRYADIDPHTFRLNTEFGFEAPAALDTLRAYPDVWERLAHLEGQIAEIWAYQAQLIQYQVEHLRRQRASHAAGYIHFWLADMVPQVGCGVLDACRRPKGGYDALRRASQPLQVALEHNGRRPRALWVFNDTMQTYPNARLRWRIWDAEDNLLVDESLDCEVIANASQRIASVRWSIPPAQCDQIELALYNRDGVLVTENGYTQPFQLLMRPRGYPWKFDPYLGTKVFDRPDAPSLANQNVNRVLRLVPLTVREIVAEWALRQQLPIWLVSAIARVVDRVMG